MNIVETTNYEQFKFLQANRMLDESKIKKLQREISLHGLKVPIMVNEKHQIIDGQHRLIACKKLKTPLKYFVAPGTTVKDAAHANQAGSNWKTLDWIHYYAAQGYKDYQELESWIKLCQNHGVSVVNAVHLAQNNAANNSVYLSADGKVLHKNERKQGEIRLGAKINTGYWKFGNIDLAYKLLDQHVELLTTAKFCSKSSFVTCIIRLNRIKAFDFAWLMHQIKKHPSRWYNCASSADFLGMIEDIYNYNRRADKRLPIRYNPELTAR